MWASACQTRFVRVFLWTPLCLIRGRIQFGECVEELDFLFLGAF
jgi:hypothetical protein